jgi:phage shock protein E
MLSNIYAIFSLAEKTYFFYITLGKSSIHLKINKNKEMINFLKKLFSGNNSALKNMIQEGALMVDVRSVAEYNSGHVTGSVNIPLDTIANNLKKFENTKGVLIFCASGMRSSVAKSILQKNNVPNIVNAGTWSKVNKIIDG